MDFERVIFSELVDLYGQVETEFNFRLWQYKREPERFRKDAMVWPDNFLLHWLPPGANSRELREILKAEIERRGIQLNADQDIPF